MIIIIIIIVITIIKFSQVLYVIVLYCLSSFPTLVFKSLIVWSGI